MALNDITIGALNTLAVIQDSTTFVVVDDGLNYKTTVGDLREALKPVYVERFFGSKISNFVVPISGYNVTDDINLTTPILPAGRYLISYANQYNFNAVKDKSIAYQLTGDMAGAELTQSMSTGGQGSIEDSNYGFYKDLPLGSINFGIKFRTFDGTDHGFVVDFCDIMILWVGDTPAP